MLKKLTRTTLAVTALMAFAMSDGILTPASAGGASALSTKAFNPQPEPPKWNSGKLSPGSTKAVPPNGAVPPRNKAIIIINGKS